MEVRCFLPGNYIYMYLSMLPYEVLQGLCKHYVYSLYESDLLCPVPILCPQVCSCILPAFYTVKINEFFKILLDVLLACNFLVLDKELPLCTSYKINDKMCYFWYILFIYLQSKVVYDNYTATKEASLIAMLSYIRNWMII